MTSRIVIRPERAGDQETISAIVKRAYAEVGFSDHREHLMVERLRESEAFIPTLSLIAELDGTPAGHILLTRVQIRGGDRSIEALALAPLSVVPECQGFGVGRQLVQVAHARAAEHGFGLIVLVGLPDYYPQFGYEPLNGYPIDLPFSAPDDNCMVLALRPGALSGVAGMVEYADGWLNHEP